MLGFLCADRTRDRKILKALASHPVMLAKEAESPGEPFPLRPLAPRRLDVWHLTRFRHIVLNGNCRCRSYPSPVQYTRPTLPWHKDERYSKDGGPRTNHERIGRRVRDFDLDLVLWRGRATAQSQNHQDDQALQHQLKYTSILGWPMGLAPTSRWFTANGLVSSPSVTVWSARQESHLRLPLIKRTFYC